MAPCGFGFGATQTRTLQQSVDSVSWNFLNNFCCSSHFHNSCSKSSPCNREHHPCNREHHLAKTCPVSKREAPHWNVSLKDFVMFDLSWFLDLLSVQCMLGYELGRNLEVMVVSFSLPVLVVFALALGFYKWGSPFYGLKYAIVVTSIGYQVAIQCTWGNLFWCETKSARGWDLGKASFLSQRPFISCSDQDLMKDDLMVLACPRLLLSMAL